MSTTRYYRDGMTVSTFGGPVGCNPRTGGRACVQITVDALDGGRAWLMMSMDHWVDLVCFVRAMDAAGVGILSTPEVDDVDATGELQIGVEHQADNQPGRSVPAAADNGPPVEIRLVLGAGLVAGWHNPRTLAAMLTRGGPGGWVTLWPGISDEQVFYRCVGCGQASAFPVIVQARRA